MPITNQTEVHRMYFTTADVGRTLTIAQLATASIALGVPEDADPVRWLEEKSTGVILYRHGDGAVTIHRAPVTRYTTGMGWVA